MVIKHRFTKNAVIIALLFMGGFILPLHTVGAVTEPEPLYFGSVAMDIPAVMHKRLTPLTNYLSKKLMRPVILTLSPDMQNAIENVANGSVDFAYLTPVAYIRSHEEGNTQLIAKTITNKKDSFQLMIVVREDSDIQRVEDLAGKSFAFGDPAALLQRAVVVGAGMPLEKLGSHKFLGHYDNIVRAVLNRDFDAGILKDTKAFMWEKKGVRILYSSPELPPYNIAASSKVNDQVIAQLRDAFLSLDNKNPEHLVVINALSKKYNGFSNASDQEYDIVRKLTNPFKEGR